MSTTLHNPRSPRVLHIAMLAGVLCAATAAASTDRMHGARALITSTIAPRGGVMMVPLTADRPGDHWPAHLDLTLADGRVVQGTVAWIHRRAEPPRKAAWTFDPSGLAVRAVRADDDTSRAALDGGVGGVGVGGGAPFLLAALPEDGDGPVRLGEHVFDATWRSPREPYGTTNPPGPDQPRLELWAGLDRPDAESPFEYWRWVLLADRLELHPPEPAAYGEVGALLARHYADMWRIGLIRLSDRSPAVAATCRDLLTRVCLDEGIPFAAWVAAPEETGPLIAGLLDLDGSEEVPVRQALAWTDARGPIIVWTEAEHGPAVRLAIVNRGFKPLIGKMSWASTRTPPVAVALEPGRLTRVNVDRPPPVEADPRRLGAEQAPAQRDLLDLSAGGQTVRLAFGPRAIAVAPPGAVLAPFPGELELALVQRRAARNVALASATSLHLRRRMKRWEAFFECRRPGRPLAGTSANGGDPLGALTAPRAIRGVEAVVLALGDETNPTAVLAIPESGPHRLLEGARDGALEVHRRSYSDRWYCRVVLPDSWLDESGRMSIACLRAHGDSMVVESAPLPTPPWRPLPAPAIFDLTAWDAEE